MNRLFLCVFSEPPVMVVMRPTCFHRHTAGSVNCCLDEVAIIAAFSLQRRPAPATWGRPGVRKQRLTEICVADIPVMGVIIEADRAAPICSVPLPAACPLLTVVVTLVPFSDAPVFLCFFPHKRSKKPNNEYISCIKPIYFH